MGLKCRLLGHAYSNPEVERTREEQGDEVVVTVRNVEVCERCGDEQVVNQTKEVTSVRSPEEVGLEDAATSEPTAQSATADTGDATPEPDVASVPPDTESPEPDAADPSAPTEIDGTEPAEPPTDDPEVTPESTVTAESDRPGDAADSEGSASEPPAEPTVEPAEPETASGGGEEEAESPIETVEDVSEESLTDADSRGEEHAGASVDAESSDDGWETGSDDWDDVETDVDDAVILDAEETNRDRVQWPEEPGTDPDHAAQESAAAENGEPAFEDAGDQEAVTNDAEIIDAEGDATDGEASDEIAAPETGASAGGWPDPEAEDEGYAATPGGDAEIEFGESGGLTPEVNGGGEAESDPTTVDGVAVETDDTSPDGSKRGGDRTDAESEDDGFTRAGESATLESDVPADRIEFYCPNCGHARTAGASSIRAGDICPECKKGYIAEREQ